MASGSGAEAAAGSCSWAAGAAAVIAGRDGAVAGAATAAGSADAVMEAGTMGNPLPTAVPMQEAVQAEVSSKCCQAAPPVA